MRETGAMSRGWISDRGSAKVHLWKNGYHSLEHALIGYLTGNGFVTIFNRGSPF
jgi:hypothetical protein